MHRKRSDCSSYGSGMKLTSSCVTASAWRRFTFHQAALCPPNNSLPTSTTIYVNWKLKRFRLDYCEFLLVFSCSRHECGMAYVRSHLSVCLSVLFSSCSCSDVWKLWPRNYIVALQVQLRNISVSLICQGHSVKVKVTGTKNEMDERN